MNLYRFKIINGQAVLVEQTEEKEIILPTED